MNTIRIENNLNKTCAVSLQQVHVSYGIGSSKVEVLKGVSLNVAKGTIFGLLGPSGCGKTTLLKCVVSCLKPNQGIINVFNQTPGSIASKIPGSGVGYMPQEIALYLELTIRESLAYFGRLHHMTNKNIEARTEFLLEFLNLPQERKLIKNLSGGEQRRVSFAIALLHQPPLLILDEPTVGVDPILRQSIWNYLFKISLNENVTIIVTTHYIEEARNANKVALMRDGNILAEQQPDLLIEHYNASNLEDVFLKLCEAKSNITNQVETSNISCDTFHSSNLNLKSINSYQTDDEKLGLTDYFQCPSLTRINAMIIKNFIKMWRNFMLMIFQFLSPAVQVMLFFWAVGSEPHDLNVAVFNQDTFLGTKYLHYVNNYTIHQIPVNNLQSGEDLVTQGKAWAVIYIWPNFSSALIQRFTSFNTVSNETLKAGTVHIRHDNTDQQITYSIQKALYDAFDSFSASALKEIGKIYPLPLIPVEFDEPIYGPIEATFTEYIAPGLLISLLFYLALNLTSISFIMDKKEGLLDRSYVSGATSFEVMCGHILTQLGVMVVHVCVVLVLSIEVFNIENKGSFVWIILLALCQGLCGMCYGFLISAICNDGTSAMMLAMGSFYPLLMTSGVLWPIEGMPNILQTISQFLPMTLAINAMGWILSHGKDITWFPVWRGFAATWAWILCFIILSTVILRLKK